MRIVALRPKLNTPDARGKIVNVVSTDMLIKDDAGYLSRGKSSEAATYRKVGIRALVIQMYLSMLDALVVKRSNRQRLAPKPSHRLIPLVISLCVLSANVQAHFMRMGSAHRDQSESLP